MARETLPALHGKCHLKFPYFFNLPLMRLSYETRQGEVKIQSEKASNFKVVRDPG